jgi:hypothetical protein
VLLTIIPSTEPYVQGERRVEIECLSEGLVRVTASFGFMERLDIARITHACASAGLHIGGDETTYYSADPHIVPVGHGIFRALWRGLYVVLRRNARSVTSTLGIPADADARLGVEVPDVTPSLRHRCDDDHSARLNPIWTSFDVFYETVIFSANYPTVRSSPRFSRCPWSRNLG